MEEIISLIRYSSGVNLFQQVTFVVKGSNSFV